MAEENSSFVCLPEELKQEILLRLPCESLVRFESVCKTWSFMFHSGRFIDLYGRRALLMSNPDVICSSSTANLLKMFPVLIDSCSTKTTKTNTEERWKQLFSTLGPLNGIYCLTAHCHEFISKMDSVLTAKIVVCNPATHDYKVANPFPRKFHSLLSNSSKYCRLHLGFGNVKVQKNNSNSLDYRVVVLIESGKENSSVLVFVYSVLRGAWKKIVDYETGNRNDGKRKATEVFNMQGRRILHISYPLEGCTQRFFEGCYYWMATVTAGEDVTRDVLSFNFADQSFKLIGGPPPREDYFVTANGELVFLRCEVFVLHDHLVVIHLHNALPSNNSGVDRTVEVVVWMMMEYGVEESWTRIHTIKPNFDREVCRLFGIHYHPLKSGGICIERLYFGDSDHKIFYWDEDDDGGGCEVNTGYVHAVCWNTFGISTYIETLERL